MKYFFIAAILFSVVVFSKTIITATGEGQDWGYTSEEAAKENAFLLAQEACSGNVTQIGDWNIQIISHKEGMFRATATSQFSCEN